MNWTLPLPSGRSLRAGPLPGVMGVLNLTPDSFSDGARFPDAEAAAREGIRFADLGVSLVDIGGESTRPKGATYGAGAVEISVQEEVARVLPVIERLRKARPAVPISIDTRRKEVAAAAFEAGADVVNIVTGLDVPEDLLSLVSVRRAPVVLNHCRGTPATTFEVSRFTDVVREVAEDLAAVREAAAAAGIAPENILLDPGLGFGKVPDQNFALLASLGLLAPPGVPLVVGASRKAFLGTIMGKSPSDRLPESLAAVVAAVRAAATRPVLVRVHDVEETVRFLAVLRKVTPA